MGRHRRTHDQLIEFFWASTISQDDCLIWTRGKTTDGYGVLVVNGKNMYAHRFAWELANKKKFPKGLMSRHTCDNPSCVKASHIIPGTARENSRDITNRGRRKNGNKTTILDKFPKEVVDDIVDSFFSGATKRSLSIKHSIKYERVRRIIYRACLERFG